ncbi:hypothetical protein PT184_01780 [Erysipelothrix rhusiopathiae]|nr:hypothetical protein [Erysipelothrix rhusiopathiae]MDE8193618.1 hypothetical protein [Erysipelothrix rhusiopathiae]MDE8204356.1 hypothetical protein [Erysipelothrix rhusiopathiae]MDE8240046.1 hypothetical protein [Erysipelothrix rhusiopathiae]MDE8288453.1 hypothetical protein [Erysipelothrix rhusiopathiae]
MSYKIRLILKNSLAYYYDLGYYICKGLLVMMHGERRCSKTTDV